MSSQENTSAAARMTCQQKTTNENENDATGDIIVNDATRDIIVNDATGDIIVNDAIPEILLESTVATAPVTDDATDFRNQFANFGTQLPIRHSTRLLNETALRDLYVTVSGQLVNIKKLYEGSVSSPRSATETTVTKLSQKAQAIVDRNTKNRAERDCNEIIGRMKAHHEDILNGSVPTIDSLKGILFTYTSANANFLMKLIMLKALIRRRNETNDNTLIPMIFKLVMIMFRCKSEWATEQNDTTDAISPALLASTPSVSATAKPAAKKSRREQFKETVKAELVSTFEFPSPDEIMNLDLKNNIQIRNAIQIAVDDAFKIISTNNLDPIKHQMIDTYDQLDDMWDQTVIKLDTWQREVMKAIDKKETIIVSVPTGTGKTVCAQYCVVSPNNNKVLFVVPSAPLAFQVAGSFKNAGYNVALMTDHERYCVTDSNIKVYVATPSKAEEMVLNQNLAKDLDYVVFDEIQQLNNEQGECYERMIKTINCAFLILSATMDKPEKFATYLKDIKNVPVKLVKHNKRSIVQQRMIWNSESLIPLHPLAAVDRDYIINDQFKTGDNAMTSRDLYVLGCRLSELFPEVNVSQKLHPNMYFDKFVPITSEMVLEYERHLKSFLVRMAVAEPTKIDQLLSEYAVTHTAVWTSDDRRLVNSIVDLFKTLKREKLLPALVFMMDDVAVLETYTKVIEYIEEAEKHYFPWYGDLMLRWYKQIINFNSNETKLKESIANGITSRGSKLKQIEDTMNQKRREFIKEFLADIKSVYDKERGNAINNKYGKFTSGEINMICEFLDIDYHNKVVQHQVNQLNAATVQLPHYNPYCPTSVFTFHHNPLSAETMTEIVKDLKWFTKHACDKQTASGMGYDNIFVRGLERGIILHSNILPAAFQRMVQKLVSRNQAPICFADGSLKYGVNLPTRTVVILGSTEYETICTLDAQQMAGRSGRRGFDTKGNIVFCRVNFNEIMRGTYAPLTGRDTITPYTLLPAKIFSEGASGYIENVVKMPLKYYMQDKGEEWQVASVYGQLAALYKDSNLYNQSPIMLHLIWLFRDDVAIAPNIFPLVANLISIAAGKTVKIQIGNNSPHPYLDEDATAKAIVSKEGLFVHELPPIILIQVIEMLFRVFDRYDEEEEVEEVDFLTKDIKFNTMLMDDTIWSYGINLSNSKIIRIVALNEAIADDVDQSTKTAIILRIDRVAKRVLTLYNSFAELGNKVITSILDHPLTVMLNKLNKMKSLA
jgi:hypothetical protein